MSVTTRLLRRLSAAAAAVATALAVCLVSATPAAAHDSLVSTDPASGSTVDAMPTELSLTYSAELLDAGDGTAVEVRSPSGADATGGEPVLNGAMVTVPLAETGEAGEYTVTWRVVSSDGHPIDGTFSFTVSTGSAPQQSAPSTPTPESSATDAPEQTPTAEPADDTPAQDGLAASLPWIVGGVLVVGGAAVLVTVLIRRGRGR